MLLNPQYVGWFAMSIFSLSFFVKAERSTLYFQLVGALVWITYGLLIGQMPVVFANALVAGGAAFKLVRIWRSSAPKAGLVS